MKYTAIFISKEDMYPEFVPMEAKSDNEVIEVAKVYHPHSSTCELVTILEGDVRVVYPPRGVTNA